MDLLQFTKNYYYTLRQSPAYAAREAKLPVATMWQEQFAAMNSILEVAEDAKMAVRLIADTVLYQINTHQEERREATVDWHIENLRKQGVDVFALPDFAQDTDMWEPVLQTMRGGRRFCPDFFRVLSFALQIQRLYPEMPEKARILELGAGLGHLPRLLKQFKPHIQYCIVDIPETLIFSFMNLSLCFPDKKILLVKEAAEVQKFLSEDYDFLVIPATFADELAGAGFDLFINTCSLGEMDNKTITYWVELVQKQLHVSHAFLVNRFLNVNRPEMTKSRQHENTSMLRFDTSWQIEHWQLEPSYLACPYHGFIHARYLEMFIRRCQPPSAEEARKRSHALLHDALLQEWIPAGNVSSSWVNGAFSVDTSMGGIIFKLWEALRLNTNRDSLLAMLRFIDTRSRGYGMEFEEAFYWEQQLESWLQTHEPNSELFVWLTRRRMRRSLHEQIERVTWGHAWGLRRAQPPEQTVQDVWNDMEMGLSLLWQTQDFNITDADYSQARLDVVLEPFKNKKQSAA